MGCERDESGNELYPEEEEEELRCWCRGQEKKGKKKKGRESGERKEKKN